MKKSKTTKPPEPPKAEPGSKWPWIFAGAAVLIAWLAYLPALEGEFVFDDRYLPFLAPDALIRPIGMWIGKTRPVLLLSFWAHLHLMGQEPYSYHLVNLLLHLLNAGLVFLILKRLLERLDHADARNPLLAGFGAALFLLHPLQTESVAYVASRSEALCGTFVLGSLAVFLLRREGPIAFPAAAGVLALFGLGVLTKEQAAVLPAVFLLLDYWWNPGFSFTGIRRNWRLYAPVLVLSAAALAFVWRVLSVADSAGFRVRGGISWSDYFLTQCRVIWTYIRMYVAPYGLNVDPDVPFSRSLMDHGAVFGLAGLAALAAAAWIWRKREPLASFGLFLFLVLLAPTSSFIPIRDPQAERRLYLPILGLILITLALLRRWKTSRGTLTGVLAAVLALAALLTWQRNHVWAGPIPLWTDTVAKSPAKSRPAFQLAFTYYEAGRCAEAAEGFEKAYKLDSKSHELLVDWALALDCTGQYLPAVDKLQKALLLEKTAHAFALLGMVHAKGGSRDAALLALAEAEKINSAYDMTYAYLGNIYLAENNLAQAEADFLKALARNANNPMAAEGLQVVRARLRAPR
jgi:tetratricopeptide (TPR) repeat protein